MHILYHNIIVIPYILRKLYFSGGVKYCFPGSRNVRIRALFKPLPRSQVIIVGYTLTSSTRNITIGRRTRSRDVHVPFSTSALMLIVRNRSSSFSYSIPRDALLSSVRFGLRVASRRRDRNMDDVPAGGTIPPPSKPNTTSANLTLLPQLGRPSRCNCNSCTPAGLSTPCRCYTSYYNIITPDTCAMCCCAVRVEFTVMYCRSND